MSDEEIEALSSEEENYVFYPPPEEEEEEETGIPLTAENTELQKEPEESARNSFAETITAVETESDDTSSTKINVRVSVEMFRLESKYKPILEYDISGMFPNMYLLITKPRREWNYNDPEVIRAMWMEQKTNILAKWMPLHSRRNVAKTPKVNQNRTVELRKEYQKRKKELKVVSEARESTESWVIGRDAPSFEGCELPATLTADMRYHYSRNNPQVPLEVVKHYLRYKKPPFVGGTRSHCDILSR